MSWVYCASAPPHPRPAQNNRARYLAHCRVKFCVIGSRHCSRSKVTQWEDGSCRGAREEQLTWGKGGEQKHHPAQCTWLVLVPALTRWQRRAQQKVCAWTGGLEQLKHAKRTTTESLTNQLRFSFPQDDATAVSMHRRLSMYSQLGQGHAALL